MVSLSTIYFLSICFFFSLSILDNWFAVLPK
jgi:hypothetical protein